MAAIRIAFLLVVINGSFAPAGELTVKLTAIEIDKAPYAVPLVAPGACCAAVGESVGKVAIGQKINKEAHVSLYPIDDVGKMAGAPVSLKLPKPATLAQRDTYPLALAFHPSLPLLYVWQEVERLKGDPVPPAEPAWKDFDHLQIYAVDRVNPELLVSLCRGPIFHTGCVAGSLGLDPANGMLYVPNLRFGEKNPPDSGGIGWFSLDADGLPIEGDKEPAKAEPIATAAKAAAARPARAAALRAAVAANKPVGAFRHTPPNTYCLDGFPAGAGFVPFNRDVFIAGGSYGLITWNKADRRARAQVFLMPINFTVYYMNRLTGHPKLPVVFVSIVGYSSIHRMEHAEGFLTLAPQLVSLDGAVLKTPSVVLTKRNLVAFGGPTAVYLASIDAVGKFKDEKGIQINVPMNPIVEGLVYSEKFDRLYIAVEKPK